MTKRSDGFSNPNALDCTMTVLYTGIHVALGFWAVTGKWIGFFERTFGTFRTRFSGDRLFPPCLPSDEAHGPVQVQERAFVWAVMAACPSSVQRLWRAVTLAVAGNFPFSSSPSSQHRDLAYVAREIQTPLFLVSFLNIICLRLFSLCIYCNI